MKTFLNAKRLLAKLLLIAMVASVAVLGAAPSASAVDITVTTLDDTSAIDGFCSLREAIEAANTNLMVNECPAGGSSQDAIELPAGLITLTSPLPPLTTPVAILGAGADATTIDGNDVGGSVLVVQSAAAEIQRLTLTGGLATNGGGLFVGSGAFAGVGGVAITDNTASSRGGGIYVLGELSMVDSTISLNMALNGGGLGQGIGAAGAGLVNTTISGNTATGIGGGVYVFDQEVNIFYSTVTRNTALNGGGIASYGDNATSTILAGSIVADNVTTDANGSELDLFSGAIDSYESEGFNVLGSIDTLGTVLAADATNLVDQSDVSLADLALNANGTTPSHAPIFGSPAIDHVTTPITTTPPATGDQNGNPRQAGFAIDAGSVEVADVCVSPIGGVDSEAKYNEVMRCYTNAAADMTANLTGPITFAGPSEPVQATHAFSLTINGDGHTLTAAANNRVMTVASGNLLMNNATLTGGDVPGHGGGIFVDAFAKATLSNMLIHDNQAFDGGGAGNDGDLTIKGSQILSNTAFRGGGIFNSGTLTVSDSTVDANNLVGTTPAGAGIQNGSPFLTSADLTVERSTISGNTGAVEGGGGIGTRADSTTTVTNTTISGNEGSGGGVYHNSTGLTTIRHTTITANTSATGTPGLRATQGQVDVDFSIIADNGIQDFNVNPAVTLNLAYNVLGTGLGAVSAGNNLIDQSGLGLIPLAANAGGTTLSHNLPTGSVAIDFIPLDEAGVITEDQNGTLRPLGGGADAGAVEVPSICLPAMTAADQAQLHAAIRCHNAALDGATSTISITQSITYDMPVLAIDNDTTAKLIINGNNNTINAMELSRAIRSDDGETIINDLIVTGGDTDGDGNNNGGGGIYIEDKATLTNVTATGNNSDVHGGGIQLNADDSTITDSLVTDNTATDKGGGIHTRGITAISGTVVTGNSAEYGGGISMYYGGTIQDSTVSDNAATEDGGGIYADDETTITSSTISDNTADDDGGGIYTDDDTTITSSTVSGNTAVYGGGIYSNDPVEVYNSTVSGNTADYGGGIYVYYSVLVSNSTISGNTATIEGGGFYHDDDPLTVLFSTVTDNTAPKGAGIHDEGDGDSVTIAASIVAGNNPSVGGNDIDADGGGNYQSSGFNVFGSIGVGGIGLGTDTTSVFGVTDPGLAPLAVAPGTTMATHALDEDSPAIDFLSGFVVGTPPTDQVGNPRPVGDAPDAGAIESQEFNTAPVATNDAVNTAFETAINFNVITGTNGATADTDIDGDTLTIQSVGTSAEGITVGFTAAGAITYTPPTGFDGTDTFTYTITDGDLEDTATVTVTVNELGNAAPVATNDAVIAGLETAVTFNVITGTNGATADTDADGDTITVTAVGVSAEGVTVASTPAGELTYTPPAEFTGADTFTYTITDGTSTTTATVTVNVVALCAGRVPTLLVTAGQPLTGTSGNDVILGSTADDTINGGAGNDTICGVQGNDTINGEAGNDKLYGAQGHDIIDGGDGDDVLHGNRGDDELDGGDGADRIFGYANNDTINGGPGDDRLHGNFGDDVIDGGDGDDRIFGYGDNDTINGGAGDDLIGGNFGDDIINGGADNDTLYGSDGADTVNGNAGNDEVAGNSGPDTVTGGPGDDTLDGGINPDTCNGGPGTDTAVRCETLINIP